MFITKKAYKELVDSKEHWKNLAHRTLEQNEALLKDHGATEEGLTSRGGRHLRLPLRFGLRPQTQLSVASPSVQLRKQQKDVQ